MCTKELLIEALSEFCIHRRIARPCEQAEVDAASAGQKDAPRAPSYDEVVDVPNVPRTAEGCDRTGPPPPKRRRRTRSPCPRRRAGWPRSGGRAARGHGRAREVGAPGGGRAARAPPRN